MRLGVNLYMYYLKERNVILFGKKIESTSQHWHLKKPYQISLFPSEIIANVHP